MLGRLVRRMAYWGLWPASDWTPIDSTLNQVDRFRTELATAPTDESGYFDIQINQRHTCVVVDPPHKDREAAQSDPEVYSKDYRYVTDTAEVAHMQQRAQISAIHIHGPEVLREKDNILFPF